MSTQLGLQKKVTNVDVGRRIFYTDLMVEYQLINKIAFSLYNFISSRGIQRGFMVNLYMHFQLPGKFED